MSNRSDILRHLEPIASPSAAPRAAGAPHRSLDGADFRSLIDSMQGEVQRTNRPVTLAEDIALTPDQQSRLERAADAALAHDSHTALVLLDGRPLMLDVKERNVTEEIRTDLDSERVVTDIDTLIVSRSVSSGQGEPAHSLMLRRLSGEARTATVSRISNGKQRAASPSRTIDIGESTSPGWVSISPAEE